MIGWIIPKMIISGIRIIRIRLRLATTSESRTDWLIGLRGCAAAGRVATVAVIRSPPP